MLNTSFTPCNNDDTVAGTPPPPRLKEGFLSYAEGGAPTMTSVTGTAANESTKTIVGFNSSSSNVVDIKLTYLIIGTYTIGASNQFAYTRVGTSSPWTAGTGTITVSSVASNKILGSFNLTSGTSSLGKNSVTRSFSDITINP